MHLINKRTIHLEKMKSTINILKDHLQARTLVTKAEVGHILQEESDCNYSGNAYRVILQSTPSLNSSVIEDVCFSKSLNGIKYYISMQDLEHYKFIKIYKVNIARGIDVSALVASLCEEDLSDLFNNLIKEEEILASLVTSEELIYSGEARSFNF